MILLVRGDVIGKGRPTVVILSVEMLGMIPFDIFFSWVSYLCLTVLYTSARVVADVCCRINRNKTFRNISIERQLIRQLSTIF